jgi:hypothetical protein
MNALIYPVLRAVLVLLVDPQMRKFVPSVSESRIAIFS